MSEKVNFEEFRDKLLYAFNENNLSLDENMINKFYDYYNLFLEYNEITDLSNIYELDETIYKHFLDSCMLSNLIEKDSKVVDLGTGAGFPGIPLKIIRDDLDMTLVDSNGKRTNFLNKVCESLNLKNTYVIHARVDDLARNIKYRERFDYSVSRAVAPLNTLTEYMLPYVKIGGYMLAMKGSKYYDEVVEAENAISVLGGKLESEIKYSIGEYGDNHIVARIKKCSASPKNYPRINNKPRLNPIK